MREITQDDINLLFQTEKIYYSKCVLYDKNNNPLDEITGTIQSGNYTIDSDSIVRRTCSLNSVLKQNLEDMLENEYFIYTIRVFVGMYSIRKREIIWYPIGEYCFDNKSRTYDSSTNSLNLSLVDLMGMLDSDHRGTLYGASKTVIRAIDPVTGQRYVSPNSTTQLLINGKKIDNSIANAMQACIQFVDFFKNKIADMQIDDIGVYSIVSIDDENEKTQKAQAFYESSGSVNTYTTITYTSDGKEEVDTFLNDSRYRYNEIPYDLEFDLGSSVQDEIVKLRDLYSNYETFFDVDSKFICQMIPSGENEPVILDNDIFEKCVISENYDTNIYDVKNVIEIWGKQNEPKNYSVDVMISNFSDFNSEISSNKTNGKDSIDTNAYTIKAKLTLFNEYTTNSNNERVYQYTDGLILAIKIPTITTMTNASKAIQMYVVSYDEDGKLQQRYPVCQIKNPVTNGSVHISDFNSQETYLLQYSASINGWYYLGQYQVHALAVLSNGKNANYNIQYFSEKYNCCENAISIVIDEDSPYCIEKIGEIVEIKKGDDYENITSSITALSNAEYELWKSSTRQDNIKLTTILIPFLDVNQKVTYVKKGRTSVDELNNVPLVQEYLIKKIDANLGEGTMSIEMMTYRPLYKTN